MISSGARRIVSTHGTPRPVETVPTVQVSQVSSVPAAYAFSRESFFETWLQQLSAWCCDAERNVLMRMMYIRMEEHGILEGGFSNPAEEDFPQDPDYDFADRPSPFFARGGICDVVVQRAEGRRISPERFLEKVFGDSVSADQVFYALFGDTPPDTKGLVFPKRNEQ